MSSSAGHSAPAGHLPVAASFPTSRAFRFGLKYGLPKAKPVFLLGANVGVWNNDVETAAFGCPAKGKAKRRPARVTTDAFVRPARLSRVAL